MENNTRIRVFSKKLKKMLCEEKNEKLLVSFFECVKKTIIEERLEFFELLSNPISDDLYTELSTILVRSDNPHMIIFLEIMDCIYDEFN